MMSRGVIDPGLPRAEFGISVDEIERGNLNIESNVTQYRCCLAFIDV